MIQLGSEVSWARSAGLAVACRPLPKGRRRPCVRRPDPSPAQKSSKVFAPLVNQGLGLLLTAPPTNLSTAGVDG